MPDEFVTKAEHDEFARRLDEENNRQNHRIAELENTMQQLSALTISVERMAVSVENMAKELGNQGDRLAAIESKPLKTLGDFKSGVIGAIASAIGCGIVAYIVSIIRR